MRPEDEYRLRRPLPADTHSSDADTTSGSFTRDYRERPGCLTLWLAINVIAAAFGFVSMLPYFGTFARAVSPVLAILLFADVAAQGVGAYLILQWKRRGVQIMVASSLLYPVLFAFTGYLQVRNLISTVVTLAILYYFISPRWSDFEE